VKKQFSEKVPEKTILEIVDEVAKGRISRKQFLERGLAMGLSVSAVGTILAACGKKVATGNKVTTTMPAMDTTKPKSINLWNWADYMDNATKANFTKKYGIKVNESYFDDNEALYTKLIAGGGRGYDVMVPSDYMVHILIKSNLVEPLDIKGFNPSTPEGFIPNFEGVGPTFKNPVYDNPTEFGGFHYSVPYAWGTTGIGHRTDVLPATITGWTDLWNPAYSQKIQMLNDEREDLGAALKKNGFSLNTEVQSELDTAVADLIKQKPLVRAYDSISPKSAMIKGMALTHCWTGDVVLALWSGAVTLKNIAFVLPVEGIPTFVDNLCVPTNPSSRYGAHMFMNYLLDPTVQAPLQAWIGYFSPVPAAVPLLQKLDSNVYAFAPTEAQLALKTTEVYNDLGSFAQNYSTAWQTVKGA
jgi:spermidine/putrescine transport system substrate-binding protein